MSLPKMDRGWAFFLDVDGTLVEIADHPAAVTKAEVLNKLLLSLQSATSNALALISGRTIHDLDNLFDPLRLPCAGQHGAERRTACGATMTKSGNHALDFARHLLQSYVLDKEGLLLEDKGLTLSIHFRNAPARARDVEKVVRDVVSSLNGAYVMQAGKMVFEIRPMHCDKGQSIREFMTEYPFAGCLPVFIGDDLTDEHGFAVVKELKGYAIKVGPGQTCAQWRTKDVSSVLAWLDAYVNHCVESRG